MVGVPTLSSTVSSGQPSSSDDGDPLDAYLLAGTDDDRDCAGASLEGLGEDDPVCVGRLGLEVDRCDLLACDLDVDEAGRGAGGRGDGESRGPRDGAGLE